VGNDDGKSFIREGREDTRRKAKTDVIRKQSPRPARARFHDEIPGIFFVPFASFADKKGF
jgi:hypothetical protein